MTPNARVTSARVSCSVAALLLAGVATACGGSSHANGTARGTTLTGLLGISAGACSGATTTGSYFRMVTPAGQVGRGPYVSNADSSCKDKTVTVLAPGTDGGLRLSSYQSQPSSAFASSGDSTATAIVRPVGFFAVKFGVSTNAKDPQTGAAVPTPKATRDGNTLTVDLQAWSVAWNHQEFNQGAPKPRSTATPATGTFNPATGAYTLDWSSKIKGGPFNGFTGVWHLTGTLHPA